MKPNWKDAPSWARWLTRNIYGQWWWHSKKPKIMTITWVNLVGKYEESGYVSPNQTNDWKLSLEKRPKDMNNGRINT